VVISIIFANNRWSIDFILDLAKFRLFLNVYKTGLLYCFEKNVSWWRKIAQVPLYAYLMSGFLYLCQKTSFSRLKTFQKSKLTGLYIISSWQRPSTEWKIRVIVWAEIILAQNSQPFGVIDVRPFTRCSPQVKNEGCSQWKKLKWWISHESEHKQNHNK
jgi:hypothetical protein